MARADVHAGIRYRVLGCVGARNTHWRISSQGTAAEPVRRVEPRRFGATSPG